MAAVDWLEDVRRLLEHVAQSDATEVELAREGFRVRLKRRPGLALRRQPVDGETRSPPYSAVQVLAPLTGVFYRASSPGAAPLVSEGDLLGPETVVGLIETMKIFNEVTAECRGRVRQILVESGQLVHAGDVLMLVESTGGAESAEQVES